MRYLLPLILVLGFLGTGIWFWQKEPAPAEAEKPIEAVIDIPAGPIIDFVIRTVEDGDTFTKVMEDLGLSYGDALEIVDNASEIFDFTSIKLGKDFKLITEDAKPVRIEYEPGTEYMIVVHLDDLKVEKKDIEYEVEVSTAELTINTSLYHDGLNAGMSEELIIAFAEVFAWEIDFATAVQQGDSMKVLYEKRFRDGKEAGIGDILAGEFVNVGTPVRGFRFIGEDGKVAYYNDEGDSLIRPFLKAPLHYSRITSGFTYNRFHPVIGKNTPHRAIDYAAATGTPIFAVGDGVIKQASWNGGYGNFISIRHNERFVTNYGHLSSYAKGIKPGVRVKQGQTIGYVGSTGWSTGPHLHYEVSVNGTLVNPLKVEFPKGDSIAEEQKQEYFETRDSLAQQLDR